MNYTKNKNSLFFIINKIGVSLGTCLVCAKMNEKKVGRMEEFVSKRVIEENWET
jgi:hypothetical protein